MQSENLNDEQLWRGIAQNTGALSALIEQQLKTNRRPRRLRTILAYARTIDALERQYRIYSAELRRRYSLESEESADLTIRGSDAATVTVTAA
jgi:hypothetical protein